VNFDAESSNHDDPRGGSDENPFRGPEGKPETDVVEAQLIESASPQKLSASGIFAWAVVGAITLFLVSVVAYSQFGKEEQVGGDATTMDLMPIQLQGKIVVAQKDFAAMQGMPEPSAGAALPKALDSGPYEQRLCYSILVNELSGPTEAIEHIEQTDEAAKDADLALTPHQSRLRDILLRLMDQYEIDKLDSSSIPLEDREFLETKLHWLGRLALLPKGSPQTVQRDELESEAMGLLTTGIFAMLLGGFFGFVGFVLAVLFLILFINRRLKPGFSGATTDTNIYIETFAVWMVLFFGSSLGLSLLNLRSEGLLMIVQPAIFFGSLIALGWPLIRGVSFSQVRQDIGWTAKNPLKEAALAFPAYLATATFLVPVAIILSVVMSIVASFGESHEFARQSVPSHPVQEYLVDGNPTFIALVFLTACVCAPVVEETMFRGVLYRHLRDVTGKWRRWLSVIFAAFLNGLIFASIHPQGAVGVPLLTTLAIGFSLTREWRGSLVSPMVMHGIHNFLVTCVVLLIL
jgi:membrane protease YdiL (CAAX protease family)